MGAAKIDHKIMPIVKAMNKTGYMETVSSCEGHLNDEIYDLPYIRFFCKAGEVDTLAAVLNRVYKEFEQGYIMLHVIFDEEAGVCQRDAPGGYLCLQLNFCLYDHAKMEDKLALFKITAREFNKSIT